ncbi:DUF6932 family protein [Alkanindiges illinoisensis]|uniref:DUF6932 family protein n=1 Tax=Alkanindiges illinoisensis TaxID=197183 RepID=UPI001419740E|nr:hypothetical protein [Alkanindiges illinoisensis]
MIKKIQLFDMAGVIPPIAPGESGSSLQRSPYVCTMPAFIDIFAATHARINILKGLLNYRQELYKAGVIEGFQWLNGSFVTDIETLESRPPNDIDAVTFFELPPGETQRSFMPKAGDLFLPHEAKKKYSVDGYQMVLGQGLTAYSVNTISYWYSMWSHRKSDNMWKGFFHVPLSPGDDAVASKLLTDIGGDVNEC